MRESCKYGSVRGAGSNPRPYRNRREFIAALGGAVAWPLAVRAQPRTMQVIGLLVGQSSATLTGPLAAFRQGLSEAGFVEGRNLAIVYRSAEGKPERLPALAAELAAAAARSCRVSAICGFSASRGKSL